MSARAPIELVAEMIPALIMNRVLFRHETPGPDVAAQLVDALAMPLLAVS